MALSQIKITFNSDLTISDFVNIDLTNSNFPGFNITMNELWVNLKTSSNQVSLGTPTVEVGERSAINFIASFSLDYGLTGFTINRTINEVIIICPEVYLSFLNPSSNNANVVFEITNNSVPIFAISNISFSQATNPCTHVLVNVDTTELATNIIIPAIGINTNNPFQFEVTRSTNAVVKCENATGDIIEQSFTTPTMLNVANIVVNVVGSPVGGTASISMNNTNGVTLEFSLDDIVWQTSNVFSGLATGAHTIYIRDLFGCKIDSTFDVDEFGIQNASFLISKSNSIRFANRITWGDCSNHRNDENTLSCESFSKDPNLVYTEIQQFQTCDVVTTQFKSNYDNISAVVIKEDGSEDSLTIDLKSNNIGLNDKRDARKYDLGNGKTGIYFLSGNLYDYVTGIDTGNDYALNGALPNWAIIGNYIEIGSSWFFIQDIIYDDVKNAEVIVIDSIYTGLEITEIVASIYNVFNYEVYEFTIDMVDYINQTIQVRINNDDPNFDNRIHLSEKLNVKVQQKNTVEIRYKNSQNTDIFYATGIEHVMRLPIKEINGKVEDNFENYKTDSSALLLSSEVYELDEFVFEPITKEIMRKLTQAISQDNLRINGVLYVKSSSIELTGPLGDTNFYEVKVTLVKAGNVFNSQVGDSSNELLGSSIEIPGLLDFGGGFVTYQ